jgi:RimJ/RimL family protein N-acetyltransferase
VDLHEDDWRQLRYVRLRSLRQAGGQLGGVLEVEKRLRKFDWQNRIREETWFAVRRPNRFVGAQRFIGIVTLSRTGDCDRLSGPHPHIEAIWVSCRWRKKRVATALVAKIVETVEVPELGLWVFDGNDRARDLFAGLGFAVDGAFHLFEDGRKEQHMFMEIRRPGQADRLRTERPGHTEAAKYDPDPRDPVWVSATPDTAQRARQAQVTE